MNSKQLKTYNRRLLKRVNRLTDERNRARRIAVHLEQELAANAAPVPTDREALGEKLALVDDHDGCHARVREWEALEQWAKDAHPDEEPFTDREDAEWWNRRADAVIAHLSAPDLRNAIETVLALTGDIGPEARRILTTALAVQQMMPEALDERIAACDALTGHPFFRECYETDGTLIAAMLAKLSAQLMMAVTPSPATAVASSRENDLADAHARWHDNSGNLIYGVCEWVRCEFWEISTFLINQGAQPETGTAEWGVRYETWGQSQSVNQFPDKDSCKRFIESPPLWFEGRTSKLGSLTVVSRFPASEWAEEQS